MAFSSDTFLFVFPSKPAQPGPEFNPGFGTGSSTGEDNPFQPEDNTPYENDGDNIWAPGFGTGSSPGDDNPFQPEDNTPYENGGDDVWAPRGHDDVWF